MYMKNLFLLAVLLLTAVAGRAEEPVEGPGDNRVWLTTFTAVEVAAPLDIRFIRVPDTEAPRIIYNTKGSTTTRFRAEVVDKVLRVSERYDSRRTERTSVTVCYNNLERISVADAEATFADTLSTTLLDMTIGGSARVTATLDVKDLRMEVTGKGQANLSGDVRYLTLYVSSGTFAGEGLEVMSAQANVTGSGTAALWVTDRFEGKTSTGGKITYKGSPGIVRCDLKFMGGEIAHTGEE